MVLALLKDGLNGFDKSTCIYTTETSFRRHYLSIVGALYFLFYSISFFSDGDQLNKLTSEPAYGFKNIILDYSRHQICQEVSFLSFPGMGPIVGTPLKIHRVVGRVP